ncbi:MAG: hypothetical protein U0570_10450 [Phycisphaerales bacterium]
MTRLSMSLAAVTLLLAGSAHAGVIINAVDRNIAGTACVNAPPWTLNWCESDSGTNSAAGNWFKSVSQGPSAAGEIGSASSVAQASQATMVINTAFTASMGMYTYVDASGTCNASTSVSNNFSVRFSLASPATMHVSTTANNSGLTFALGVWVDGGAQLYATGLSDEKDLALGAGSYKFSIAGQDSLSCGLCFSSKSTNWNVTATFDFGPCAGDFNGDLMVDDADFSIFAAAYNDLICPDYPTSCPGDLNGDAYVDDADFPIFVVSYNELVCP